MTIRLTQTQLLVLGFIVIIMMGLVSLQLAPTKLQVADIYQHDGVGALLADIEYQEQLQESYDRVFSVYH